MGNQPGGQKSGGADHSSPSSTSGTTEAKPQKKKLLRSLTERRAKDKAVSAAKKAALDDATSQATNTGHVSLPPCVGELVYTAFGPGVVIGYNAEDQLYQLTLAWRLDQGTQAVSYMNMESVFKDDEGKRLSAAVLAENVFPSGQRVETQFGKGEVDSYNLETGIYKVSLDWQLDGGSRAAIFSQPEQVLREVVAKKGDFVLTPYGTGIVEGIRQRDGAHIITITQMQGTATAFLSPDAITKKLKATVGAEVITQFGPGVILRYRREDDIFIVALPYGIAYLNDESIVRVVDAKKDGQKCIIM